MPTTTDHVFFKFYFSVNGLRGVIIKRIDSIYTTAFVTRENFITNLLSMLYIIIVVIIITIV